MSDNGTPARPGNAFEPNRGQPAPADAWGRAATLTPEQKAAAAKQAELVAVVGRRLASRPYPERRAILAHMAPHLAARGIPPASVTSFDPTDANLATAVGHAVVLGGMLNSDDTADSPPSACE